jgi:hypothetical protein
VNLEWAIVAEETHEDGESHLHVAMSLKQKVNYKDPRCLDFIGESHGNYQAMKNQLKCLEYITKEDKEPAAIGIDFRARIRELKVHKSGGKAAQVETLLLRGADVNEVIETVPGFTLLHFRAIEAFQRLVEHKRLLEVRDRRRVAWRHSVVSGDGSGAANSVVNWLKLNILQERPRRQKQLYIYGNSEMGKSTIVEDYLMQLLSLCCRQRSSRMTTAMKTTT